MKHMNKLTALSLRAIALLLTTILCATVSMAQDGKTPPSGDGTYIFSGGLTAGYRSASLTNADGSVDTFATARYNEAYNLQKGVILNSINLFGEKRGTEGFFDEMYLNASGINDPFTTGSFRMRAFNSYDLKVDYRSSKYYLNRNDSILSGLHKYDFTRTTLSASLDVNASDNLKVNVQFNSTGRSGDATLTHNAMSDGPFSTGGSSSGPFWSSVPRNDKTSDFTGSLMWQADPTFSLALGGGYRSYSQTINGTLLGNDTLPLTFQNYLDANGKPLYVYDPAIQPQINQFDGMFGGYIAPNTAKGASLSGTNPLALRTFTQTEDHASTTPYFFLNGVWRPTDDVDVTADVRSESTSATPTFSIYQAGVAGALLKKGAGYVLNDSTYNYSATSTAMSLKNSRLVGSLNLTGRLMDELSATGRVEYSKTTEDGSGTYLYSQHIFHPDGTPGKVFPDTTLSTTTSYSTPQMAFEGFLNYAPVTMLALKAGVRFTSMTPTVTLVTPPTATPDSLTNAVLSEKTTSMTPYLNFNLRPSKDYRIDGRYSHTTTTTKNAEGSTVDNIVRTVPASSDNFSLGLQGSPMEHLSASLRFTGRLGTSTLLATNIVNGTIGNDIRRTINLTDRPYDNKMTSLSASLGYSFGKELSVYVSGEYKTNTYDIPVTWGTIASGATTMNTQALYGDSGTFLVKQNTIDRYLDVTLRSDPISALHISAGLALTSSSGGVLADSSMRVLYNKDSISTTLNPKGVYQDRTLFGGPFSSYQAHVTVSYDITDNVGLMADYELVYYKEDASSMADYWALNNYKASLIRGGFSLKF